MPRRTKSNNKRSKNRKRRLSPVPDLEPHHQLVPPNQRHPPRVPLQYSLPPITTNSHIPAPPVAAQPVQARPSAKPAKQNQPTYSHSNTINNLFPATLAVLQSSDNAAYQRILNPVPISTSNAALKPTQVPSAAAALTGPPRFRAGTKWVRAEIDEFILRFREWFGAGYRGKLLFQKIKGSMHSTRSIAALRAKYKYFTSLEYKGQYRCPDLWELQQLLDSEQTQFAATDHVSLLAKRTAYREKKRQEKIKEKKAEKEKYEVRDKAISLLLERELEKENEARQKQKLCRLIRDKVDVLKKNNNSSNRFDVNQLDKIKRETVSNLDSIYIEWMRLGSNNCRMFDLFQAVLDLLGDTDNK